MVDHAWYAMIRLGLVFKYVSMIVFPPLGPRVLELPPVGPRVWEPHNDFRVQLLFG